MWTMQMSPEWHHQGLFMGLHWLWWLFWLLVAFVVGWAFWQLVRDERGLDREESRREDAEEVLRRRFSEGELEEDGFLQGSRVLRESRSSYDGRSVEG